MQRGRPQLRPNMYGDEPANPQGLQLPRAGKLPTFQPPIAQQYPVGAPLSNFQRGKPEFSIHCTFGMVSFYDIMVVLLSEFIGTLILMFFGCSGLTFVSITMPIAIATATIIFGDISGGHINPAVTIAAVITGQIRNVMLVPFYIVGQFAGGFAGYALYHAIMIEHFENVFDIDLETFPMCATLTPFNGGRGFGFEFLMSIFYIMTICALWDYKSNASGSNASVGLKRAFIYFGMVICTTQINPSKVDNSIFNVMVSLNSIRSLVPLAYNDVLSEVWKNHWIYWVAPNLGAALGASLYVILKWCHRQSVKDE